MRRSRTVIAGLVMIFVLFGVVLTGSRVDAASTGWASDSKGWWYVRTDGTYPKNQWEKISGSWYHFNSVGYMDTGWLKDGKNWYYLNTNGKMQTGWKKIDGKWYYFSTGGVMQDKWQKIDSKWYYFQGGAMQTGWKKIDTKWYYFGTDGDLKTGWQTISKKKYYFGTDGAMKTGWQTISKKKYYFNSDGEMQTGWKTISSKKYYLGTDGVMRTGWQTISKKKYYFGTDGVMRTGWQTISKKKYYFGTNGVMVTGTMTIDGKPYCFDKDGVLDEKAYDFSGAKVGDVILFGNYEQDNDAGNGKERIEWRVLEAKNGELLLMSEKILDSKHFHETEENVTWETCDLRKWLNQDFLSAAFIKGEQNMISLSVVSTPDSEYYGTDSGKDTEDKVFLLSYDEISTFYDDEEYTNPNPVTGEPIPYTGSKDRAAAPTAYALAQGAATHSGSQWYCTNSEWWLRSMGADQTFVSYVGEEGYVFEGGNHILNNGVGVRPVIRIKTK